MKMTEKTYLNRLFRQYYREKQAKLPSVSSIQQREFGFFEWDRPGMNRHMAFDTLDNFKKYLIDKGPRHVYNSGALYLEPDNLVMENKLYQGCDLIIDIDVDHFFTPCKEDHDIWFCVDCNKSGKGMHPVKCPICSKTRFKNISWICEECLEVAKKSISTLIHDFLFPDFGIKEEELNIAFSGHRGYHIKVENKKVRTLSSESRREIVDYLSGNNISFEVLGFRKINQIIYGLRKDNIGWSQKIVNKIEEILKKPNDDIQDFLFTIGINRNAVESFLNSKDDFLTAIARNQPTWAIEGFGFQTWQNFLEGVVEKIGVEIDEPVSIDVHRLIRYPGTLHGKTGFKVQELTLDQLEDFNPLNEQNNDLDPIVFKSEQSTQKLEIIENSLPATKLKDETFGPYKKGEVEDVPHHFAVFLLCKEVARSL